MGPVGSAILRAWLYEAKMLDESAEEARAVAGPTDEIRAEVEVRRARGRGGGTWMRRGGGLGEDDESDKSQESGESGGTSEEEEEEEGRSAFVGRTNNVAGSGRRRGGDRGMEEVTERLDVGRGGLGMGIGVVGDVPVVSRAQTSNRSQACAQVRGCTDPACRNRLRCLCFCSCGRWVVGGGWWAMGGGWWVVM
jgi:hypothetical protein